MSVKRGGSHLFLRYAFATKDHVDILVDEEFGIPIAATMPFPGHLGRQ